MDDSHSQIQLYAERAEDALANGEYDVARGHLNTLITIAKSSHSTHHRIAYTVLAYRLLGISYQYEDRNEQAMAIYKRRILFASSSFYQDVDHHQYYRFLQSLPCSLIGLLNTFPLSKHMIASNIVYWGMLTLNNLELYEHYMHTRRQSPDVESFYWKHRTLEAKVHTLNYISQAIVELNSPITALCTLFYRRYYPIIVRKARRDELYQPFMTTHMYLCEYNLIADVIKRYLIQFAAHSSITTSVQLWGVTGSPACEQVSPSTRSQHQRDGYIVHHIFDTLSLTIPHAVTKAIVSSLKTPSEVFPGLFQFFRFITEAIPDTDILTDYGDIYYDIVHMMVSLQAFSQAQRFLQKHLVSSKYKNRFAKWLRSHASGGASTDTPPEQYLYLIEFSTSISTMESMAKRLEAGGIIDAIQRLCTAMDLPLEYLADGTTPLEEFTESSGTFSPRGQSDLQLLPTLIDGDTRQHVGHSLTSNPLIVFLNALVDTHTYYTASFQPSALSLVYLFPVVALSYGALRIIINQGGDALATRLFPVFSHLSMDIRGNAFGRGDINVDNGSVLLAVANSPTSPPTSTHPSGAATTAPPSSSYLGSTPVDTGISPDVLYQLFPLSTSWTYSSLFPAIYGQDHPVTFSTQSSSSSSSPLGTRSGIKSTTHLPDYNNDSLALRVATGKGITVYAYFLLIYVQQLITFTDHTAVDYLCGMSEYIYYLLDIAIELLSQTTIQATNPHGNDSVSYNSNIMTSETTTTTTMSTSATTTSTASESSLQGDTILQLTLHFIQTVASTVPSPQSLQKTVVFTQFRLLSIKLSHIYHQHAIRYWLTPGVIDTTTAYLGKGDDAVSNLLQPSMPSKQRDSDDLPMGFQQSLRLSTMEDVNTIYQYLNDSKVTSLIHNAHTSISHEQRYAQKPLQFPRPSTTPSITQSEGPAEAGGIACDGFVQEHVLPHHELWQQMWFVTSKAVRLIHAHLPLFLTTMATQDSTETTDPLSHEDVYPRHSPFQDVYPLDGLHQPLPKAILGNRLFPGDSQLNTAHASPQYMVFFFYIVSQYDDVDFQSSLVHAFQEVFRLYCHRREDMRNHYHSITGKPFVFHFYNTPAASSLLLSHLSPATATPPSSLSSPSYELPSSLEPESTEYSQLDTSLTSLQDGVKSDDTIYDLPIDLSEPPFLPVIPSSAVAPHAMDTSNSTSDTLGIMSCVRSVPPQGCSLLCNASGDLDLATSKAIVDAHIRSVNNESQSLSHGTFPGLHDHYYSSATAMYPPHLSDDRDSHLQNGLQSAANQRQTPQIRLLYQLISPKNDHPIFHPLWNSHEVQRAVELTLTDTMHNYHRRLIQALHSLHRAYIKDDLWSVESQAMQRFKASSGSAAQPHQPDEFLAGILEIPTHHGNDEDEEDDADDRSDANSRSSQQPQSRPTVIQSESSEGSSRHSFDGSGDADASMQDKSHDEPHVPMDPPEPLRQSLGRPHSSLYRAKYYSTFTQDLTLEDSLTTLTYGFYKLSVTPWYSPYFVAFMHHHSNKAARQSLIDLHTELYERCKNNIDISPLDTEDNECHPLYFSCQHLIALLLLLNLRVASDMNIFQHCMIGLLHDLSTMRRYDDVFTLTHHDLTISVSHLHHQSQPLSRQPLAHRRPGHSSSAPAQPMFIDPYHFVSHYPNLIHLAHRLAYCAQVGLTEDVDHSSYSLWMLQAKHAALSLLYNPDHPSHSRPPITKMLQHSMHLHLSRFTYTIGQICADIASQQPEDLITNQDLDCIFGSLSIMVIFGVFIPFKRYPSSSPDGAYTGRKISSPRPSTDPCQQHLAGKSQLAFDSTQLYDVSSLTPQQCVFLAIVSYLQTFWLFSARFLYSIATPLYLMLAVPQLLASVPLVRHQQGTYHPTPAQQSHPSKTSLQDDVPQASSIFLPHVALATQFQRLLSHLLTKVGSHNHPSLSSVDDIRQHRQHHHRDSASVDNSLDQIPSVIPSVNNLMHSPDHIQSAPYELFPSTTVTDPAVHPHTLSTHSEVLNHLFNYLIPPSLLHLLGVNRIYYSFLAALPAYHSPQSLTFEGVHPSQQQHASAINSKGEMLHPSSLVRIATLLPPSASNSRPLPPRISPLWASPFLLCTAMDLMSPHGLASQEKGPPLSPAQPPTLGTAAGTDTQGHAHLLAPLYSLERGMTLVSQQVMHDAESLLIVALTTEPQVSPHSSPYAVSIATSVASSMVMGDDQEHLLGHLLQWWEFARAWALLSPYHARIVSLLMVPCSACEGTIEITASSIIAAVQASSQDVVSRLTHKIPPSGMPFMSCLVAQARRNVDAAVDSDSDEQRWFDHLSTRYPRSLTDVTPYQSYLRLLQRDISQQVSLHFLNHAILFTTTSLVSSWPISRVLHRFTTNRSQTCAMLLSALIPRHSTGINNLRDVADYPHPILIDRDSPSSPATTMMVDDAHITTHRGAAQVLLPTPVEQMHLEPIEAQSITLFITEIIEHYSTLINILTAQLDVDGASSLPQQYLLSLQEQQHHSTIITTLAKENDVSSQSLDTQTPPINPSLPKYSSFADHPHSNTLPPTRTLSSALLYNMRGASASKGYAPTYTVNSHCDGVFPLLLSLSHNSSTQALVEPGAFLRLGDDLLSDQQTLSNSSAHLQTPFTQSDPIFTPLRAFHLLPPEPYLLFHGGIEPSTTTPIDRTLLLSELFGSVPAPVLDSCDPNTALCHPTHGNHNNVFIPLPYPTIPLYTPLTTGALPGLPSSLGNAPQDGVLPASGGVLSIPDQFSNLVIRSAVDWGSLCQSKHSTSSLIYTSNQSAQERAVARDGGISDILLNSFDTLDQHHAKEPLLLSVIRASVLAALHTVTQYGLAFCQLTTTLPTSSFDLLTHHAAIPSDVLTQVVPHKAFATSTQGATTSSSFFHDDAVIYYMSRLRWSDMVTLLSNGWPYYHEITAPSASTSSMSSVSDAPGNMGETVSDYPQTNIPQLDATSDHPHLGSITTLFTLVDAMVSNPFCITQDSFSDHSGDDPALLYNIFASETNILFNYSRTLIASGLIWHGMSVLDLTTAMSLSMLSLVSFIRGESITGDHLDEKLMYHGSMWNHNIVQHYHLRSKAWWHKFASSMLSKDETMKSPLNRRQGQNDVAIPNISDSNHHLLLDVPRRADLSDSLLTAFATSLNPYLVHHTHYKPTAPQFTTEELCEPWKPALISPPPFAANLDSLPSMSTRTLYHSYHPEDVLKVSTLGNHQALLATATSSIRTTNTLQLSVLLSHARFTDYAHFVTTLCLHFSSAFPREVLDRGQAMDHDADEGELDHTSSNTISMYSSPTARALYTINTAISKVFTPPSLADHSAVNVGDSKHQLQAHLRPGCHVWGVLDSVVSLAHPTATQTLGTPDLQPSVTLYYCIAGLLALIDLQYDGKLRVPTISPTTSPTTSPNTSDWNRSPVDGPNKSLQAIWCELHISNVSFGFSKQPPSGYLPLIVSILNGLLASLHDPPQPSENTAPDEVTMSDTDHIHSSEHSSVSTDYGCLLFDLLHLARLLRVYIAMLQPPSLSGGGPHITQFLHYIEFYIVIFAVAQLCQTFHCSSVDLSSVLAHFDEHFRDVQPSGTTASIYASAIALASYVFDNIMHSASAIGSPPIAPTSSPLMEACFVVLFTLPPGSAEHGFDTMNQQDLHRDAAHENQIFPGNGYTNADYSVTTAFQSTSYDGDTPSNIPTGYEYVTDLLPTDYGQCAVSLFFYTFASLRHQFIGHTGTTPEKQLSGGDSLDITSSFYRFILLVDQHLSSAIKNGIVDPQAFIPTWSDAASSPQSLQTHQWSLRLMGWLQYYDRKINVHIHNPFHNEVYISSLVEQGITPLLWNAFAQYVEGNTTKSDPLADASLLAMTTYIRRLLPSLLYQLQLEPLPRVSVPALDRGIEESGDDFSSYDAQDAATSDGVDSFGSSSNTITSGSSKRKPPVDIVSDDHPSETDDAPESSTPMSTWSTGLPSPSETSEDVEGVEAMTNRAVSGTGQSRSYGRLSQAATAAATPVTDIAPDLDSDSDAGDDHLAVHASSSGQRARRSPLQTTRGRPTSDHAPRSSRETSTLVSEPHSPRTPAKAGVPVRQTMKDRYSDGESIHSHSHSLLADFDKYHDGVIHSHRASAATHTIPSFSSSSHDHDVHRHRDYGSTSMNVTKYQRDGTSSRHQSTSTTRSDARHASGSGSGGSRTGLDPRPIWSTTSQSYHAPASTFGFRDSTSYQHAKHTQQRQIPHAGVSSTRQNSLYSRNRPSQPQPPASQRNPTPASLSSGMRQIGGDSSYGTRTYRQNRTMSESRDTNSMSRHPSSPQSYVSPPHDSIDDDHDDNNGYRKRSTGRQYPPTMHDTAFGFDPIDDSVRLEVEELYRNRLPRQPQPQPASTSSRLVPPPTAQKQEVVDLTNQKQTEKIPKHHLSWLDLLTRTVPPPSESDGDDDDIFITSKPRPLQPALQLLSQPDVDSHAHIPSLSPMTSSLPHSKEEPAGQPHPLELPASSLGHVAASRLPSTDDGHPQLRSLGDSRVSRDNGPICVNHAGASCNDTSPTRFFFENIVLHSPEMYFDPSKWLKPHIDHGSAGVSDLDLHSKHSIRGLVEHTYDTMLFIVQLLGHYNDDDDAFDHHFPSSFPSMSDD